MGHSLAQTVEDLRVAWLSNAAGSRPLSSAEKAAMIDAAAKKIEELFDVLQIDHENDHNTRDTPRRVAKMYVEEILHGRYSSPPKVTEFDNVARYNQMIVTGPIELRSTCAHHLMPIYGSATIGVVPSETGKVVGLSKYDRIVQHFAARLQIQEELTSQIADHIMAVTRPAGLAVRISAVHMCKTHRGVRASHDSRMVTTMFHGTLRDDPALRREFIEECGLLERSAS